MQLFDALHMSSLLLIALLFFGLFFLFRRRSARAKYIVLGVIMGVNLLQHLFKFWVWPHMRTGEFGVAETAYNVCAFMILCSPYVIYGKHPLLKQFHFYIGVFSGFCAPLIPIWFIGKSIFTWEFLRFYTCHVLLFLTAALHAAWGFVEFRMKDGWKFGLYALAALGLILANNALTLTLLGYEGEAFVEALYSYNPVIMMGPVNGTLPAKLLAAITPSFFRLASGRYIPILWYAVPVYLMFTVLGYAFGAGLEHLQKKLQQRCENETHA